ncbi:MerR family transcriptional regulator [Leisingera aquaemixtae]|uniref:MerR family transcriptional regulator n=1 Tax=Leisingera aquaemixtae TaxID=1396826 RepID=UPI0021BD69E6|nr:MerR family transcriptional regulator [Leisingera aquaemixtae]
MSKSPDAFRTISEVADWLGVQAHVLRFWESKFTQVKPVKRAGGRRYYRPADMQLLGGIRKLLHDDGMAIKEVQALLREHGTAHVAGLSHPLDGEAAEKPAPVPPADKLGDDWQGSLELSAQAAQETPEDSSEDSNVLGFPQPAGAEAPPPAPAAPASPRPEAAAAPQMQMDLEPVAPQNGAPAEEDIAAESAEELRETEAEPDPGAPVAASLQDTPAIPEEAPVGEDASEPTSETALMDDQPEAGGLAPASAPEQPAAAEAEAETQTDAGTLPEPPQERATADDSLAAELAPEPEAAPAPVEDIAPLADREETAGAALAAEAEFAEDDSPAPGMAPAEDPAPDAAGTEAGELEPELPAEPGPAEDTLAAAAGLQPEEPLAFTFEGAEPDPEPEPEPETPSDPAAAFPPHDLDEAARRVDALEFVGGFNGGGDEAEDDDGQPETEETDGAEDEPAELEPLKPAPAQEQPAAAPPRQQSGILTLLAATSSLPLHAVVEIAACAEELRELAGGDS